MYDTKQLLAVLMLVAMASGVAAQNYPTKPLRMILPFPPGGPTDLVGRLLAQKLGEQLGQQVASDNRPGRERQYRIGIGCESATGWLHRRFK